MIRAGLRGLALAIAVAAFVDPAFVHKTMQPVRVDIRASASASDPDGATAARVKAEIERRLASSIDVTTNDPAALVLVGGTLPATNIPEGIPVSTVSVRPQGRYAGILDARVTDVVVPGQRARIAVDLEARDMAGQRSLVVLERNGLEVARATHDWSSSEGSATITLSHTMAAPGVVPLRIRLEGAGGDVDVADVAVRVIARRLKVLAWEARPSWSVAFIRRTLEGDDVFDVSSLVRSSRGVTTEVGKPPAALSSNSLAPFDVVVVGAPEDLTQREVEALDTYMRVRGGAVVFAPDRLPGGPYRTLLPPRSFEEVLLDRPANVESLLGPRFLASEFALPAAGDRGVTLASMQRGGRGTAAIASWPRGAGLVVLSGVLDGWRYRGTDNDGFATFWSGILANLALSSPPPMSVSIAPGIAAPGDRVTLRARYRASELTSADGADAAPAISALLVARDGAATPVRLWPSVTFGEYEADIEAPAAGPYDVRVTSGTGAIADAALLVAEGVRSRRFTAVPPFVPEVTGGVAVDAGDTGALESQLRALPRTVVTLAVHPMRSPWWILPFAAALCVEWAMRRRKGLP